MFTYRGKIIRCDSSFEEEDDEKAQEPFEKVTLADFEAVLPPYYEQVIGKLQFIDKTHEESGIVDIESLSDNSMIDSTADKVPPKLHNVLAKQNLERGKDDSESEMSCVEHSDDDDETTNKKVVSEGSDSEFEMRDGSEAKAKVNDLNEVDDDVTDMSGIEDDERSDVDRSENQRDEESDDADTSGPQHYDEDPSVISRAVRDEYAKKLKDVKNEHRRMGEEDLALQCNNNHRPNFVEREQKIMLYYLITKNKIYATKGKTVWEKFRKDKYLTYRRVDSLWNHMMKTIIPKIENFARKFELPKTVLQKFQQLRSVQTRNRR